MDENMTYQHIEQEMQSMDNQDDLPTPLEEIIKSTQVAEHTRGIETSVMAIGTDYDDRGNMKPVRMATANMDEQEYISLLKSMLRSLPKGVLVDLMHSIFHDRNIENEELHSTLVWFSEQFSSRMDNLHPKTVEFLKLANHRKN